MSDKSPSLYDDLLMRHYRAPQHTASIPSEAADAEVYNPTCGDRIRLTLHMQSDVLEKVAHDTEGCAICTASASIMASSVPQKSSEDILHLHASLSTWLRNEQAELPESFEGTDLPCLTSVRSFPMRVNCALLPWKALVQAMGG